MDIFGEVWENYLDTIFEDWQKKVDDDDIVLLAGDFSWAMKLKDAIVDISLISKLKGKKIIIRGNHDYWWESIGKVRSILPKDFYALQNDSIKIGDYIFCGTRGWTFDDEKLINREYIRLNLSLESAKKLQTNNEKIICLIHYPPFEKGYKESIFTKLIDSFGVHAVVYGHIHSRKDFNLKTTIGKTPYYLTSCDMVENKLIQID